MKRRIGLLFGGMSTEHRISCRSAYHIWCGLEAAGYDVAAVGITETGEWLPFEAPPARMLEPDWPEAAGRAKPSPDASAEGARGGFHPRRTLEALFGGPVSLIWPAVHGVNCEDGVLQGFLEMSGIPYVGSSVLASSVGMDKITTKRLCEGAGIEVTPWLEVRREDIRAAREALADGKRPAMLDRFRDTLGYPCFLKPANGGSSVGTAVARDESELLDALSMSAQYDPTVLAETFIDARELEVAVIGNRIPTVSEVGEIVKAEGIQYYDYEAKYLSEDASGLAIPAELPDEVTERIRRNAATVYTCLGCEGLARVDFFLDRRSGKVLFNEINTLPGFTSISLYPVAMARVLGSDEAVLKRLAELALERHDRRTRDVGDGYPSSREGASTPAASETAETKGGTHGG